jgi:hypothetical protein
MAVPERLAVVTGTSAGIGLATARDLAVVSDEPGMVDTAMQAENRAASPEDLPGVELFVALQARGRLTSPERPASEVAGFLERDDLPPFSERRFEAP